METRPLMRRSVRKAHTKLVGTICLAVGAVFLLLDAMLFMNDITVGLFPAFVSFGWIVLLSAGIALHLSAATLYGRPPPE